MEDALIFANGRQCQICFDICRLDRCRIQVNKPWSGRYTPQERGIIVSIFLRNNSSVVLAQRKSCRWFPSRSTPTAQTLCPLVTNLEDYGTTRDVARSGRPGSTILPKISPLLPRMSNCRRKTRTRRRASQLAISRSSLRVFSATIDRISTGGHVVPTRRSNGTHSASLNWYSEGRVPGSPHFSFRRFTLGLKIARSI